MNSIDIALVASVVVFSALLIPAVKLSKKYVSSKWRLLFLVPAVVCFAMAGFGGYERLLMPAYIGAAVTLAGFFVANDKVRICSAVLGIIITLNAVSMCVNNPDSYRARNFTAEFEELFAGMKKHYVLADQKGIDWDDIHDRYLPLFKEADSLHSKEANYTAWNKLIYEFHDCHVYYMDENIRDEAAMSKMNMAMFDYAGAGDYGLSMMSLSDGRAAAVNVAENSEAEKAGIHNGTIITSWDGEDVYEAGRSNPLAGVTGHFADKDNEEFYLPLRASVYGGTTVTVTFIADDGSEQSAELMRRGSGYTRFSKTREIVEKGVETAHMGWVEIDENTVCFRLKQMQFDSEAASSSSYSKMKNEVIAALDKYKSEGKTNLIIDMRSNSGGAGDMVKALGEIFAPEGIHYYATDGVWDYDTDAFARDTETGKYKAGEDAYFTGEDRWAGRRIIILVNAESVSAADHFVTVMRGMENVTVMGFTESNGSAQGIGSVRSGGGQITFSNCVVLDKNGDILVDSGADYESGNDIDIRVPFDEEAIAALFDRGEDYLLSKAIEQFAE